MNNRLKAIFSILALAIFPCGASANPDSFANRYISMALQGDLSTAHALVDEINVNTAPLTDAELANRFEARFIDQSEALSPGTGDSFADAVILLYRDYWAGTLTRRLSLQEGENFLERSLLELLAQTAEANQSESSADVYGRMGAVLRGKGFYYLYTPAPPLLDLFLWKKEENLRYTVRLTDHSQPVRVTFMSEIYSKGWKEFATLGLVATTGWVEGTRLYCIDGAYDRNTENFRVSYLKHESRHLADFERFPGLSSDELEYRAKLTELAFASASLRSLLDDFTIKSAPTSESPHAYANYRVTRDMYQAMYGNKLPEAGSPWKDVNASAANRAAQKLLRQNTDSLVSASP